MNVLVWAKTHERGLFCRASFPWSLSAVQEMRVWQCGAAVSCETQTQLMTTSQNDDCPNCVFLKSNPSSPVCDGPPIWAGIRCTVLWHLDSEDMHIFHFNMYIYAVFGLIAMHALPYSPTATWYMYADFAAFTSSRTRSFECGCLVKL